MIIKPLEKEYTVVELRTTTLESSLYPHKFEQENPLRARTTTLCWHIFEECVNAAIIDKLWWTFMCEQQLKRLEKMDWLVEKWPTWNEYTDVKFLKYKLQNAFPVAIALEYYKDVMSTQMSLWRWIECGKYLVYLSWTLDHLTLDNKIYDVKYYSSEFWENYEEHHDEFTINNKAGSKLSNKIQWYVYPRLLQSDDKEITFQYHLYKKSKNAPTEKKPDEHLKRTVYNCKVDIELAEKQIKHDIIEYFTLCRNHNVKPGERVER